MKKSWKKGIAAAMSVLLAAGMAGCGQTNTANSTATSGDAATTAQTEVAQSNTDNGDLTVVKILGRNYTYTGANGKRDHFKRLVNRRQEASGGINYLKTWQQRV